MKKIIRTISFSMILCQIGNLDLGTELNGKIIFKLLVLLAIFGLTVKNRK